MESIDPYDILRSHMGVRKLSGIEKFPVGQYTIDKDFHCFKSSIRFRFLVFLHIMYKSKRPIEKDTCMHC